MIRKVIQIDEESCNGCGRCVDACHEGAIGLVNGKAKLMRDDYCDGLGDCLPSCPMGAITFIEREAAAYDEQAVLENKKRKESSMKFHETQGGCPGSRIRTLNQRQGGQQPPEGKGGNMPAEGYVSQLGQWPCQMKLVPVNAPYFAGAKLLIAADCTAFAYAGMHEEFMKGHITLVGCPKLDAADYSEKLTEILRQNEIEEVTVVRMEVPCCGGLENAVKKAVKASGRSLSCRVAVISIDGEIL